jgi:hypothetical protein
VAWDKGESDGLGTTRLEKQEATREECKVVSSWRWWEETARDRLKHVCEVERLSGQSVLSIEQDCSGRVFLATLESAFSKEAEQECPPERPQQLCQAEKPGKHSGSDSALVDSLGYSQRS